MRRALLPVPRDRRGRRAALLLAGLVLYGVTIAMMVLAGLGLAPWDVLHQGLSRTFGLGIGTWGIVVSFVVLLAWWPLGQRIGVGTIANAVIVGLVVDLTLALAEPPGALPARIALLAGGVLGTALATGLYIGAGLGPGARDGLSTAIAGRGHPMRVVRTAIEAGVLVTGYLLGGTVGIGTVLFALTIGPLTHRTIPAFALTAAHGRDGAGRKVPGMAATCTHLDTIEHREGAEGVEGCPQCLAMGSRWMHLRRCTQCGQVGCCDSSPNKHASAHHAETGHPIMRSVEPGEDWYWCFEDELAFRVT